MSTKRSLLASAYKYASVPKKMDPKPLPKMELKVMRHDKRHPKTGRYCP